MSRRVMTWPAILALAALVLAAAGLAQGTPIYVRDAATGENSSGGTPGVFLAGTGSWTMGTSGPTGFRLIPVGTVELEADFGSGWVPMLTYCFEPGQGTAFGINPPDTVGVPYTLVALTSIPSVTAQEAEYIEILWANAFATSTTGKKEAAAFQFIVWELLEDGTIDLAADLIKLDTSKTHSAEVYALANAWITNIQNGTWTSRVPLKVLRSDVSQDFLTVVPEPATLTFLLLGSLALVVQRRQRR